MSKVVASLHAAGIAVVCGNTSHGRDDSQELTSFIGDINDNLVELSHSIAPKKLKVVAGGSQLEPSNELKSQMCLTIEAVTPN